MAGKIELYREPTGDFRYRVRSRSGEIVATGPSYRTRAGAQESVVELLKAVSKAKVVDITGERAPGSEALA